jgi:flagellar FliJ-like protein
MNAKLLERLQKTKQRLRDAASLAHADADSLRHRASIELDDAKQALAAHVESVAERLCEPTSAAHLLIFHDQRIAHADAIEAKTEHLSEKAREEERARAHLQRRARELGTIERALERTKAEDTRRERSAEQRGHDDLSSRGRVA